MPDMGSKDGVRLLTVVPSDRLRGNEHKLKYKEFHANILPSFFTVRVAK